MRNLKNNFSLLSTASNVNEQEWDDGYPVDDGYHGDSDSSPKELPCQPPQPPPVDDKVVGWVNEVWTNEWFTILYLEYHNFLPLPQITRRTVAIFGN